jgi:hypothetical protein
MNISNLLKDFSKKINEIIKRPFVKLPTISLYNDKYVLYFVLFLVLADMLIFIVQGDLIFIMVYILAGLVAKSYTNNMLVILLIAMIVSNTLKYGTRIRVKEGMAQKNTFVENMIEQELSNLGPQEIEFLKSVNRGDIEGLEGLSEEEETIFRKMAEVADLEEGEEVQEEIQEELEEEEDNLEENLKSTEGMKSREGMKKSKEGMKKSKEGMKKKIKPLKPYEFKKFLDKKKQFLDDKKMTLNELESQNKDLAKTQKKLIDSMKNMEPMLSQAEQFMQQFNITKNK